MLAENKAGSGDPRDLIALYLEKLNRLLLCQKKDDAFQIFNDIKSLTENSEIIPKVVLAVNNIGETNVQVVLRNYNKIINLPSAYPAGEMWKNIADVYFQLSEFETDSKKKEKYFNKAIDYLFAGLEKAVVNYSHSREKFTSDRWGLKSDVILSKIFELEKGEKLSNEHYNKLKLFFDKYGVCIPAKDSQAAIIKDIIARRNKLNKKRGGLVELEIICDTSPWLKKDEVWLWSDVINEPILMKQMAENIYTASIIVPEDVFVVNIMFYKTRDQIPEKPNKYICEKIKIPYNATDKITVKKKTRRNHQSTIIVECNAQKIALKTNVFIIGNVDKLGSWEKVIQMSDDGKTHNDKKANDKIFTYSFAVEPETRKIEYLFYNGYSGEWGQGTPEFRRTFIIPDSTVITNIINNQYGKKIR